MKYTIVDKSDDSVSTTQFTLNPDDMTFTGTEKLSFIDEDDKYAEWESVYAYNGSYTTDGTIHTLVNDDTTGVVVTFVIDTEHEMCTIK
jgi:hypothetical protein